MAPFSILVYSIQLVMHLLVLIAGRARMARSSMVFSRLKETEFLE